MHIHRMAIYAAKSGRIFDIFLCQRNLLWQLFAPERDILLFHQQVSDLTLTFPPHILPGGKRIHRIMPNPVEHQNSL